MSTVPEAPFYPSLSMLVPLESMPPSLGFVQGVLQDVFDNLFYRDLQVQKTRTGDAGFYQLSLVIFKRLGVEIPGTGGAALVLNPGQVDGHITEIPIALSYRWEILKYVRAFDQAAVAELPRLAFDAFVEMSGVSSAGLLAELIDQFHGSASDPVQAFVDAYNLDNLPTVPLTRLNDPDPDAVIEDLLGQLDEVQEISVYELVFVAFLSLGATLEGTFEQIAAFFSRWVKDLSLDDFTDFLLPHGVVAIQNLNLALEFPRTLLKPVDASGKVIDADSTKPEDEKAKSRLTFTAGSLRYATDAGFQFDALSTFKFDRSEIGNTGIGIGFTDMKLDLSRTTNIPEATADGRPLDFVGAYVKEAEIDLPKKWFKPSGNAAASTTKIVGQNMIIGTGGFSGKVTFQAGGVLHTKLGNFEAELTKFDLRFERNAIVESNISGLLTIKGFKDGAGNKDAQITIEAHIAEDGDFSVTAKEPQGILVTIPDVMQFKIFTLGFGREDERFFLSTSGTVTLTFLDKIPALKFDRPIAVELKKLTIWEGGELEIEGGTIILPQALTLKIGPVKLSVTAISMGSYTRDSRPYKYFGFDGGVNVSPGGVDVRASGVKVYYSTDDKPLDIFVRVEGIAIDLVIPGGKSAEEATVLISGFLQMKEPDPKTAPAGASAGTEYAGGVSFKMPKAGIGGSAAMRLNPSIPSFIIDAELSISVPIPLANTGLGIYGFRGLIGMRYVADRAYVGLAADAEWYQYYKKRLPKEGISIAKFAPGPGFALGAGLTFGTLSDSGKAFSAKLFLLLSLPDALLLQGQAALMSERVDLSPNDPPFSVFIAITKQSVEAAFGADYKLPEGSGEILDLHALVEMGFFFNDSTAWYVNAGRDLPASKRVTARLFTLFDAWSYLMLSSHGIRAGAGVGWDFNKGFGPLQVEAHAYLDTRGQISFKPKQIGAAVLLGGSASVRIFKFKLGLSIAAGLAAEAPRPFIVTGTVAVHVDLPWPFRKLGGTFMLDFTWNFVPFDLPREAQPVPVFNQEDVGEAAKMVNLATRERFSVNVLPATFLGTAVPPPPTSGWLGSFDDFVVPLDSTMDIEFKKPIAPGPGLTNIGVTGTGYANTETVPPQRGKSPQVQHRYVVDEVKIRAWNPTSKQWDDYDVYAALTPLAHASFVKPADLIGLKQGWWQVDQPGRVNKLSLLSQTPLSYANDVAGPFVPENSGVGAQTIFCPDTPITERCLVVDEWQDLKSLTAGRRYSWNGVHLRVTGKDGQIVPFLNAFGLKNGVALKQESQLEIFFPEATGRVTLRLATLADNVMVRYQQRRQVSVDGGQQPVYSYVTVRQDVLNAANLLRPVTYDAVGVPVQKVVVSAGSCHCADAMTAPPALAPAGALSEGPGETAGGPDSVPPPCGSVQAYLASVCGAAQQQLDGLQHQHDQLVTQATEYQLLAAQLQGGACDPTLTPRYEQMANALLAETKALEDEIHGLTAIGDCCRSRGRASGDCNLDPAVDYACQSVVFGVCWLPVGDQRFNGTIPSFSSLLASNNAMVRAINKTIHPIWRPDTIYAVSIRTTDNVSVSERSYAAATATYMHIGFRTLEPLGFFHQHRAEYQALVAEDRPDQYRLQSLKPYIDFTTSYPRPDGNVLNAKPLFYVNPELRVFYVHPYVYTMYGGQFDAYHGNPAVKSTLAVSILDPVDPLPATAADPGHVPPVSLEFEANTLGRSDLDLRLLHNMAAQGDSCTGSGQAGGIAPMGMQSNVKVDRLKPRKLYLAVFRATYDNGTDVRSAEVHRYNFQTSRYADFAAQVNSYRLQDGDGAFSREAVYDDVVVTLDPARTAQLTALLGGGSPTGDPLERDYADPFDRLMDGILRVGPLDPPVGTDFTVVRDEANHQVLGILVRNPEAFNDPGIPEANIATTLVLSQPGVPAGAFTTLHAKDRSRAFVGAVDLDLALRDLTFTFTYLEYDGVAYAPASVVAANLFAEASQ